MTNPVYFVVLNRMGRETCVIYHDELPTWMRSKRARELGMAYALRLDTLPNADFWLSMTLKQMTNAYFQLKKAGKLPSSNLR